MKSNLLVKLSALASSALLCAAFVSYRAGAFDWSSPSDGATLETPGIPEHPTVGTSPPAEVASPAVPVTDQQIFYGSKSGAVIVEPEPAPQTASPPQQQSAVIMSGSKSLMAAPSSSPPAAPQTRQSAARVQ